jgi:AcrR family transcriptional regulator
MEATRIARGGEGRAWGPSESPAVSCGAVLGLRERKKLETFRALQSAARRLVGERGLDRVTIEEIADAANVSKRTFFNYFASKEAVLVDPEPGMPERLAAALAGRPAAETPLQALWAASISLLVEEAPIMQALSGLIAANPGLAARQVRSFAKFQKVIVEWAAERTGCDPATSVYPALLAGLATQVTQLTVTLWRPESGDEGYIQIAQEVFELLAGGLAAPRPVNP